MALEAPDAIKKWRTLMGATDPAKADAGTLRKEFGAVDREQRDARLRRARRRRRSSWATSSRASSLDTVELRSADGEAAGRRRAGHRRRRVCSCMLGVPLGRLPGDIVRSAAATDVLFSPRDLDRREPRPHAAAGVAAGDSDGGPD